MPMFSFRSFIVSGLTFRSLIQFEFLFVYGISFFLCMYVTYQAVTLCSRLILFPKQINS